MRFEVNDANRRGWKGNDVRKTHRVRTCSICSKTCFRLNETDTGRGKRFCLESGKIKARISCRLWRQRMTFHLIHNDVRTCWVFVLGFLNVRAPAYSRTHARTHPPPPTHTHTHTQIHTFTDTSWMLLASEIMSDIYMDMACRCPAVCLPKRDGAGFNITFTAGVRRNCHRIFHSTYGSS